MSGQLPGATIVAAADQGNNRENILLGDAALYDCAPISGHHHRCRKDYTMTQKQRLKYSILIALTVLGAMLGLSYLQNQGVITEKVFQYLAIGIAVVVVIINGIMRRKVKF